MGHWCTAAAVNILMGATGPTVDILLCQNLGAIAANTVSGIALINNAPNDTVLQILSFVTPPLVFLGVTGCSIPPSQADHTTLPVGNSLQLINTAGVDGASLAVDVYGYNWLGWLPSTWGAPNTGNDAQWGPFFENFAAASLGPPAALAPSNRTTPPPGGNATNSTNQDCILGESFGGRVLNCPRP